MRASSEHQIKLGDRLIAYRVVRSAAARKLRLRVGPDGVEVVQPAARRSEDVVPFLEANAAWLRAEVQRVEGLRRLRLASHTPIPEILFRGEPTRVRLDPTTSRLRGNTVALYDREIVVRRGPQSTTPAARSLENWLRKQARLEIEKHLSVLTARLRQKPGQVYVMGQRTKWGNCSSRRNLSFNWRLILAPSFVLRYFVTHEAVHLVQPDHSARFWLMVRGLCPETQRAKQWLREHQAKLLVDLGTVVNGDGADPLGPISSRTRTLRRSTR